MLATFGAALAIVATWWQRRLLLYLFGPNNRLQYDIAGTLGNGSWGYIVGTYDKDAARTTSVSISTAPVSLR
jgi:hypothetical protein